MANQERETRQSRALERQAEQRTLEPSGSRVPVFGQRYGTRGDPYSLMRRLSEDVDRLFDRMFGSFAPALGFSDEPSTGLASDVAWWPEIEVFERGGKLVVRADLPGLKKDDVDVEVRDNELRIRGERRTETEREEGRYYTQERSYGRFYRAIVLPEGANPETASATFENGVLTVEVEAPDSGQRRGRRIEVRESSPH